MANQMQLCVGAEAFIASLRADLADCRSSLDVQFTTFEGDRAGQEFADLVLARVGAGVHARMILDRYSEVMMSDRYPITLHRRARRAEREGTMNVLARLERAGVEITRVAPPGFLGRYLLFRDHKKMVILDRSVAYVGGLNISDHNYGWHDFMVRIEGPGVADIGTDFDSTWTGATVTLDHSRPDRDSVVNQCAGRPSILDEALRLVGAAETSVVVESPYLCGDAMTQALLAAAHRGVAITLVLPLRPNHLYNRVWARHLLRRLRHPNIEIRGYRGADGMTHAKLVIVDNQIATFGSCNFQEIEALGQKELNIFTRDPEFVTTLTGFVTADAAAGERIPVPRTAFGWFTYKILYRFLRWWTARLVSRPAWRAEYC